MTQDFLWRLIISSFFSTLLLTGVTIYLHELRPKKNLQFLENIIVVSIAIMGVCFVLLPWGKSDSEIREEIQEQADKEMAEKTEIMFQEYRANVDRFEKRKEQLDSIRTELYIRRGAK